jgi:hypothetical protein
MRAKILSVQVMYTAGSPPSAASVGGPHSSASTTVNAFHGLWQNNVQALEILSDGLHGGLAPVPAGCAGEKISSIDALFAYASTETHKSRGIESIPIYGAGTMVIRMIVSVRPSVPRCGRIVCAEQKDICAERR